MEPPSANYKEKIPTPQEKFKSEAKYTINSNTNNSYNIIIKNLSSNIEINAFYKDDIKNNEFINKFIFEKFKKNKFLSICESIDEIYDELIFEFSKKNSTISENENEISIIIPVAHVKYKEINLNLNKKIKSDKEICQDLYELVHNLKNKIKDIEIEKNNKIIFYDNEIKNLKNYINNFTIKTNEKIENLIENNTNLKKKVESLEKEVILLKNQNSELKEKIESLKEEKDVFLKEEKNNTLKEEKDDFLKEEKNNTLEEEENNSLKEGIKNTSYNSNNSLDNLFEEIDNPWTNEKENFEKEFDYTLKNGDYYAERYNNACIYSIKSKFLFENNNIYKLIYNIKYIKGSFRIGFGDFGENKYRLKEEGSIGLTNEGLFINGKKIENIKLGKNNSEIIFIINLKERKNFFELSIDGNSYGKYYFYLNKKIYGLAAINEGSITIKTYKSLK